jgi:Uma2 family endonuclease
MAEAGGLLMPGTAERVEPIVLHRVPWDLYEALLDVASEQRIRLNYEDGDLEIMPPPWVWNMKARRRASGA